MKKNKMKLILSVLLLSILFVGCGAKEDSKQVVRMFSEWTDEKEFQNIPAMVVEGSKVGDVVDSNANTKMIDVKGTTVEDYKAYLELLESCGFEKHSDNGEEGLYKDIYTATYLKDTLVLTVTHTTNTEKTHIIVGEEIVLSDHLIYDEKYVADNKTNAKTTLHMLELYDFGNSFLIQLKNGHFIMNDGGKAEDLPKLVEYMETLVEDGEKPVIEAWFISHVHADHVGIFNGFTAYPELRDRIYVEAVYFNEASNESLRAVSASSLTLNFLIDYKFASNSEGTSPALYCPMSGQKYYFNDVVVQVMFSQEIHPIENYGGGLNDISTWLMYEIEGQKLLIPGDAAYGSQQAVMNIYSAEALTVDMHVACHHGINVYDYFTDALTVTTLLYPSYRVGSTLSSKSSARTEQNAYLQSTVKESVAWGDGTKVFTFPYEVGTVKTMPLFEWTGRLSEREHVRVEEYETYMLNQ